MRTPPRILIVDDVPANVHILQSRLAAHGYDIVTATDGEAALAAVKETRQIGRASCRERVFGLV